MKMYQKTNNDKLANNQQFNISKKSRVQEFKPDSDSGSKNIS